MSGFCARPNCNDLAAARLASDFRERLGWLRDVDADGSIHDLLLCATHAGRLSLPLNWVLFDERNQPGATPAPRSDPAPSAPGPAPGPAASVPPAGPVLEQSPIVPHRETAVPPGETTNQSAEPESASPPEDASTLEAVPESTPGPEPEPAPDIGKASASAATEQLSFAGFASAARAGLSSEPDPEPPRRRHGPLRGATTDFDPADGIDDSSRMLSRAFRAANPRPEDAQSE